MDENMSEQERLMSAKSATGEMNAQERLMSASSK